MNFSNLLHWALVFLVVAIVAAVLGLGASQVLPWKARNSSSGWRSSSPSSALS